MLHTLATKRMCRITASTACLIITLSTVNAGKAKAASNGRATGVNSSLTETIPSSTYTNIVRNVERSNENNPNFTNSLQVVITTTQTVVSGVDKGVIADTGPVTAIGTTERGVLSTESRSLTLDLNDDQVNEVDAGAFSVSGVNSAVTISSSGVDAASSIAELNVTILDAKGTNIFSLQASALRSAASASSVGVTGGVMLGNLHYRVFIPETATFSENTVNNGVPPVLSGQKQAFPGGYLILEEKISTPSGITVNAAHIVLIQDQTGTNLEIVIGSAKAEL